MNYINAYNENYNYINAYNENYTVEMQYSVNERLDFKQEFAAHAIQVLKNKIIIDVKVLCSSDEIKREIKTVNSKNVLYLEPLEIKDKFLFFILDYLDYLANHKEYKYIFNKALINFITDKIKQKIKYKEITKEYPLVQHVSIVNQKRYCPHLPTSSDHVRFMSFDKRESLRGF
jgi:hypothetical protein